MDLCISYTSHSRYCVFTIWQFLRFTYQDILVTDASCTAHVFVCIWFHLWCHVLGWGGYNSAFILAYRLLVVFVQLWEHNLERQVFPFLNCRIPQFPAIVIFTVFWDFKQRFLRSAVSGRCRNQQGRPTYMTFTGKLSSICWILRAI